MNDHYCEACEGRHKKLTVTLYSKRTATNDAPLKCPATDQPIAYQSFWAIGSGVYTKVDNQRPAT